MTVYYSELDLPCEVNNYMVRSYKDGIRVTNIVMRITNKASIISLFHT